MTELTDEVDFEWVDFTGKTGKCRGDGTAALRRGFVSLALKIESGHYNLFLIDSSFYNILGWRVAQKRKIEANHSRGFRQNAVRLRSNPYKAKQ